LVHAPLRQPCDAQDNDCDVVLVDRAGVVGDGAFDGTGDGLGVAVRAGDCVG